MKKLIILSLLTLSLVTSLLCQQKIKHQKVYNYKELLVFFKTEKDQKNILANILMSMKKEGINFSELKLEKKSENLFLISSKKDLPKKNISQSGYIMTPNYEVIFGTRDFMLCTPCPKPRTEPEIKAIQSSRNLLIASLGIEDFQPIPTDDNECRDCQCCPKVHTTNYIGVNKNGSTNLNFAMYLEVNIDLLNSGKIKVIVDPFELQLSAAESEIIKTINSKQMEKGIVKFKEVKYY